MRRECWRFLFLSLLALPGLPLGAAAQGVARAPTPPPLGDLTREPTLFAVGYAHLDTQWRWEYPTVIDEYLVATMRDNFTLFEKYPHYIFNFSGANRYRLMREYHPRDYQRVKEYVAAGRWFPSGSAMEESDVNVPSAESLVRQILYGSAFFRKEFGKTSAEYMLPDCFGFPASLPSILAHAGITGFSTQKLTWKSAAGLPFNVGVWEGLNGRSVLAALNPGEYVGRVRENLSESAEWLERVRRNGEESGLFVDYRYYGVGDRGGAPTDSSVLWIEESVGGPGPLKIRSSTAEEMFLAITPEQARGLPRHKGDLLLIEHSAGSITSQAYMKRWNRQNELLAGAAEGASVAASWLGSREYPRERLNEGWNLIMGGQFHDILPGTSTPKAYEYSWNDQVLALNRFGTVLTDAVGAVAGGLDTRGEGTAVVVYNPLSVEREDVVEATMEFSGGLPPAVRVVGPDGAEVPAQLSRNDDGTGAVLFLARVPSVGFAVFHVQGVEATVDTRSAAAPALAVDESSLENHRYRIRLNGNGDLQSIHDKRLDRELLAAPAGLALQSHKPREWPAWNMDWEDQREAPRSYVEGPARVRVVEAGPVRVALEIEREKEGSRFVQTVRLAAGDAGNRVEVANRIRWHTAATALKATFPLAASNPVATYNWEVGTIRRANNDSLKFEVPSHQWVDLTDSTGAFGVTLLTGAKYGSDKPDDRTLRLTLVYTPGITRSYPDQGSQDWGEHEMVYGLSAHGGAMGVEGTDWHAWRMEQPLLAFQAPAHAGTLGTSFSLLSLSSDRVRVLGLKKAEESDEIVVRLVELDGGAVPDLRVRFPRGVSQAREVNGQELPVGPARVTNRELAVEMGGWDLRSFALRLRGPERDMSPPRFRAVDLPFDRVVTSADGEAVAPGSGARGFDEEGRSLPAEMLPGEIPFEGIVFKLGGGEGNAVRARGQTLSLPAGAFRRVYVLAASAAGDRRVTFRVGDVAAAVTVQSWRGFIGQWDNRLWQEVHLPAQRAPGSAGPARAVTRVVPVFAGLEAGFVKPAPVAWFATHHHDAQGKNQSYAFSYLYAFSLEIPEGARTLTLPDDEAVRIMAVTVSEEDPGVQALQPLFDDLNTDERAVARVAREFLAALSRTDTATLRTLMLPGMSLASVREGPQGPVTRTSSGADFLTSLGGEDQALLERMWDPEVLIKGRIAVVWAPYDFHLNGEFSHCGVDVFTLLKAADGWKVTGITYDVVREGCGVSPLGAPGG